MESDKSDSANHASAPQHTRTLKPPPPSPPPPPPFSPQYPLSCRRSHSRATCRHRGRPTPADASHLWPFLSAGYPSRQEYGTRREGACYLQVATRCVPPWCRNTPDGLCLGQAGSARAVLNQAPVRKRARGVESRVESAQPWQRRVRGAPSGCDVSERSRASKQRASRANPCVAPRQCMVSRCLQWPCLGIMMPPQALVQHNGQRASCTAAQRHRLHGH